MAVAPALDALRQALQPVQARPEAMVGAATGLLRHTGGLQASLTAQLAHAAAGLRGVRPERWPAPRRS